MKVLRSRIQGKQDLERRLRKGFKNASDAFDRANQEAIRVPRVWAGFETSVTYRKNGEVIIGAYRDIVDDEDTANSQQMFQGDFITTYSWGSTGDTPVQLVYFGDRRYDTYFAGRDWVQEALDNTDLVAEFKRGYYA